MAKVSTASTLSAASAMLPAFQSRAGTIIAKKLKKAQVSGKFILKHANLDAKAVVGIISALQSKAYVCLTHIKLEGNKTGTEGAIFIASALKSGVWPHLITLSLGNNYIGTEGIKAIVSAVGFGACESLKSLSLVGNNVGSEGAKAIISVLKSGSCV